MIYLKPYNIISESIDEKTFYIDLRKKFPYGLPPRTKELPTIINRLIDKVDYVNLSVMLSHNNGQIMYWSFNIRGSSIDFRGIVTYDSFVEKENDYIIDLESFINIDIDILNKSIDVFEKNKKIKKSIKDFNI